MRLVKYFERLGEEFGLILTNILTNISVIYFFSGPIYNYSFQQCSQLRGSPNFIFPPQCKYVNFHISKKKISANFPCIQNQTCLHFFQHATFYVVSHPCTKLTTYLLIFSVVSFPRSDQLMFPAWLYLPRKVDQLRLQQAL